MTTTPVQSINDELLGEIEADIKAKGACTPEQAMALLNAARSAKQMAGREPDGWAVIHGSPAPRIVELSLVKPRAPGDLGWRYYADRGFHAPQPLYLGIPQMSGRAMAGFIERQRQIDTEGWTAENDDMYTQGQLLKAAACYLLKAAGLATLRLWPYWPFEKKWFKADDSERNLQKAFALLLAEMDRRDRLETTR